MLAKKSPLSLTTYTRDNYTMMRALSFDFRSDTGVYTIPDQYMFGLAFLVNPVTEQLYTGKNATAGKNTRNGYLSKTARYGLWTVRTYTSGQTITTAASINIMPLYIKAGSIVPMGPVMEYATAHPADTIELRIYTGADGKFELYEDENDNYNYEKGKSADFTFSWNDKTRQLSISDRKGSFSGMLQHRIFNVVLVKDEHGSGIAATSKADNSITYAGKAMSVIIK